LALPKVNGNNNDNDIIARLCKGVQSFMKRINSLLENEHPHFSLLKRIGSISDNQEKSRSMLLSYTFHPF
jgi:hypothetical protein